MLAFSIDTQRCTRCGQCVQECPTRIIEQKEGAVPFIGPDNEEKCMQCQHCLALCPTAALSILGRNPDDSIALEPKTWPTLEQMEVLVRGRRSIRHYRDENVDPALIQRLLQTLANAPTGVNRRMLNFHVLDDKSAMERFRKESMDAAAAAAAANAIPEKYAYLTKMVEAYREKGKDVIFRGAPHLLVVSEAPDAPCPPQDVALAIAYFEFLAQSAGLGTVWCGLLKLLLEALPESKQRLGIPAGHEYYAILFGYPSIQFARTVQRDNGAKVRRIEL